MTVAELKAKLANLPEDMEVLVAAASGDYWRTVLANQIRSVEVAKVERSEYHRQYVLPSDGDDSVVATKEVVILK